MPYTPNSVLKLYNVPWSQGDSNIRWFDTAKERDTWHTNRTGVSYEALTTIKLGSPIKIHESYMNCLKYNYARFINPKFSNQYIYCYITNIEWGADETTYITLEEDNIQTWLDKFIMKSTFVERIHTKGDVVPLTAEPLSPPPCVVHDFAKFPYENETNELVYFCLAANTMINGNEVDYNFVRSNGISEGMALYYSTASGNFWLAVNKLQEKFSDTVKLCYAIPKSFIKNIELQNEAFVNYTNFRLVNNVEFNDLSVNINRPTTIDGYKYRNKKCATYPYCFLTVTNFTGQVKEYKFENFKTPSTATLKFKGRVGSNVTVECKPSQYESLGSDLNSLLLEDSPKLGFSASYFNGWLERNSINLLSQIVTGGVSLATGNVAGAAMTGVNLASQLQNVSHTSNQMSVPSTAMTYLLSQHKYDFGIYLTTADSTYIERVDDYFQRYGYSYNKIGSINVHNRSVFVYVKTSDSTVVGAVPTDARNELKQKLDSGVTFWHTDDIGNYNVDNI